MEVNIPIAFLDLEDECTQYGLYKQAALKNARVILFFEVGQSGQ
jgi:hypothetical protein